jgi:hypothetical protein
LQHIRMRGKPHEETCLNHAYLLGVPEVARLIVKLNRDLAYSSYRGKVRCSFSHSRFCFD